MFQIAQKVSKYFGYFWKDIGYQELSEIAQSAHTGGEGVWERERESELDGNIDKVDSSRFCFAAVQGVYLAYE